MEWEREQRRQEREWEREERLREKELAAERKELAARHKQNEQAFLQAGQNAYILRCQRRAKLKETVLESLFK